MSFPPGLKIRDYEIWGRLGEGGMSEVYLAKHGGLGIPVIIKTVRPDIAGPTATAAERLQSRILEEARLMARITNPRVVRALDAGVHDVTPYMVLEYIDGIDLAELDHSRRKSLGVGLPLWFVCGVMRDACEGLHAAHQAGVIHRDVKPSNLFGSPETGVRLGDFGIAVRKTHDDGREISGTIRFMSPEQLRGDDLDRRTDVWGAAATACDLRYGFPPFDAVATILDESVPARVPRAHTPMEAHFQHLIASMLVKDVAQRMRDAAEAGRHFAALANALRRPVPFTFVDRRTFRIGECTITCEVGDIARVKADAIVSSANYEMKMRTGVGEALRKRGGDDIEKEAMQNGEHPLGTVIATTPGRLECKRVIHAVSAWNETSCIGRSTQRTLLLADELGLRSLAFPALGTGVARVTMETCANAMMTSLRWHLMLGGTRLRHVNLVFDTEAKLNVYREVAEEALRGPDAQPYIDLGLPALEQEVNVEGVTMIDARQKTETT